MAINYYKLFLCFVLLIVFYYLNLFSIERIKIKMIYNYKFKKYLIRFIYLYFFLF